MVKQATRPTGEDVAAFLDAATPPVRADEGRALDVLFRRVTGWQPQMWGASMVGYGSYAYTYASGHGGTWFAAGFSPRKAELSIYIMPGYQNYGPVLARLGKYRLGKSCLYVRKLADIDQQALAELIATGLRDLSSIWPVSPS